MATPVGPAVFQARFEAIVNSQKQRMQLLEDEKEIFIVRRQEYREQRSRERQLQQSSLKSYVQAEEITWKIKAIEDQRDAANLVLNDLESEQRCLSAKLFELQKQRDGNRKIYECNGEEMRKFTLELADNALTIQTKTKQAKGEEAEELKCDLQRVRQFAAGSISEVDNATAVDERERIRLESAKQTIRRDVCSNLNAVTVLEQRLHEALLSSGSRKRDLAAAVETLKAEITVLHTTERKAEDLIVQAINARDRRKRELSDLECKLARMKNLLTPQPRITNG